MLISFSLSNFKGFQKLEQINLKPLTVICGANNSGKSSIIQSLLLMKQSTINRRIAPFETENALILDDKEAHLGDWAEVISKHDTEKKLSWNWKLSGEVEVEIEVAIDNQLQVSNFKFRDTNSAFSFELAKTKHPKYNLILTGIALPDLLLTWIYDGQLANSFDLKRTKTFTQIVIDEVQFTDIIVEFNSLFPHTVMGDFATQSYDVLNRVRKKLKPRGKKPKYLEFLDQTLLELKFDRYRKKNQGNVYTFNPNKRVELTIPSYIFAIQSLIKFWLSFRYIGPLRDAPKRFYLFEEIGKINIGAKGEYTPLVLAMEQNKPIPPYYRSIYEGKIIKEYERRASDKMVDALNWWLAFMNLPQLMPTPALKRNINQIKLDSAGIEVYLPDVGFGVSQILPVLIECLRTKPGETVILEQPEIHLHPSLQSKLGDFLLCMARAGKKIVVETHSEHLIKRLYLRVAQEESNKTRNILNTIFVSFDEQQHSSVTQQIVINEYGEIENWPVGFFDEDDSRELVVATLKKRLGNKK